MLYKLKADSNISWPLRFKAAPTLTSRHLELHIRSSILNPIKCVWLKKQRSLLHHHCSKFWAIILNPNILPFKWKHSMLSAYRDVCYSNISLMPSSHRDLHRSFRIAHPNEIDDINDLRVFFLQCVHIQAVQNNIRHSFIRFRDADDIYCSDQLILLVVFHVFRGIYHLHHFRYWSLAKLTC